MSARLADDRFTLTYDQPFTLFEVCPDCKGEGKQDAYTACATCEGKNGGHLTTFPNREKLRSYVAGPGWPPVKT